MSTKKIVFASGKLYWPKIVGDRALHDNYDGDGKQWAFEFACDDFSFLKEHKLLDRVKDREDPKNPDKGEYLVLKKPELTKDDEKNEPYRIYDATGDEVTEWDDRLIGNATEADLKLQIVDWGGTKKKSIYVQAIRITKLVPYGGDEFAAMDAAKGVASKPVKTKAKAPKPVTVLDELDAIDDDVPF